MEEWLVYHWSRRLGCCFPAVVVAGLCFASDVRVVADSVNLRAWAGTDYEVVGQVSRGDVLTAVGRDGEWVRVVPPTNIYLWVYSQLVKDSTVAAKVMVRAGPGINYRVTGFLSKGDKVKVRGKSANGDWLKIEAPTNCSLWISSKFVEPIATATGDVEASVGSSATNAGTELPAKPIAVTSVEATPDVQPHRFAVTEYPFQIPPELAGMKLQAGKEQGARIEFEGILSPSGMGLAKPAKWRLVKTDRRGHLLDACYLLGSEQKLSQLKGRLLIVSGRRYWVEGGSQPVVVVEQVVRRD